MDPARRHTTDEPTSAKASVELVNPDRPTRVFHRIFVCHVPPCERARRCDAPVCQGSTGSGDTSHTAVSSPRGPGQHSRARFPSRPRANVQVVAGAGGKKLSGRFWLPDRPGRAVGGWLDLSGRWPTLELADPLTPSLREVSRTTQQDGSVVVSMEPTDDDVQLDAVTVHGMLRHGPRRVTLVGATTAGRNQVWGGTVADPGEERMQAEYALLGGHEADSGVRFTQARLRLRHLDAWAQLTGVSAEIVTDGSRATLRHERPPDETVQLADPAGRLVLDSISTVPNPTVRGARLTRTAELRWEGRGGGLTVAQLWSRLIDPIRVILTLALDADSPAVALEVSTGAGGRWLQILHPGLGDESEELLPVHEVLLTRQHLGLAEVCSWLGGAQQLSPVPQLVAGVATSSSHRTVQNQLLELAAAAEGLHRRLHPDDRAISREDAKQARRDASYAVLEEVRERVDRALGHLDEPTYRERLRVLVQRGREAVPEATGASEAWISRIVDSRHGFAHQLGGRERGDDAWREYLVLLRSLRWLLTGLLLLEAGVASATLAQRLEQHQPYLHLRRQARCWLPGLYS